MPDTIQPLVFLDTETTGLRADRLPWEIAMIRRDADGQRATVIQIADVDLSGAELIGLNIGRFYQRHIEFQQDRSQIGWAYVRDNAASEQCIELLEEDNAAITVEQWTRGATIVGAVPSFDTECLAPMLRRHKLIPAWHYHLADIENMAVGWLLHVMYAGHHKARERLLDVVKPPWNSDELSRACGVEPPSDDERHTAMGDARWVMRWYDKLTGGDNA